MNPSNLEYSGQERRKVVKAIKGFCGLIIATRHQPTHLQLQLRPCDLIVNASQPIRSSNCGPVITNSSANPSNPQLHLSPIASSNPICSSI